MTFTFKLMIFAFKMMNFVLKIIENVQVLGARRLCENYFFNYKTRNCVSKTRHFASKNEKLCMKIDEFCRDCQSKRSTTAACWTTDSYFSRKTPFQHFLFEYTNGGFSHFNWCISLGIIFCRICNRWFS